VVDQEIIYDGKTITVYSKSVEFYATATSPPTIKETLDYLIEKHDMVTPGSDLLDKDVYDRLMEDTMSGFYVGESLVDGVRCHHLAFRGKEVDWQTWVQAGDKLLPWKYVITSKWITCSLQYILRISNWDISTDLPDKVFEFKPPKEWRSK